MTATATVTQTATGWYAVIVDSANTVVKVDGKRLTVAVSPDDDDAPQPSTQPLDVTLAEPQS
jgi:hypothetical protein